MSDGRPDDGWDGVPVVSGADWVESVHRAGPSTPDDVSVTWDGRRLDSKDKVFAFLAEVEADRAAGVSLDEIFRRQDELRSRA
ncbi:MAG: hypothetical protein M3066_13510 [Actinomycetota bacterium]|nr:hypothetical protein [Actinomycetota bacterium]